VKENVTETEMIDTIALDMTMIDGTGTGIGETLTEKGNVPLVGMTENVTIGEGMTDVMIGLLDVMEAGVDTMMLLPVAHRPRHETTPASHPKNDVVAVVPRIVPGLPVEEAPLPKVVSP
jgi:hypothetical protein